MRKPCAADINLEGISHGFEPDDCHPLEIERSEQQECFFCTRHRCHKNRSNDDDDVQSELCPIFRSKTGMHRGERIDEDAPGQPCVPTCCQAWSEAQRYCAPHLEKRLLS